LGTFLQHLGKVRLSFITDFFAFWTKQILASTLYPTLFCNLTTFSLRKTISLYIPHYFFAWTKLFLNKMYPHPLLLTFFRFERRFFEELTNYLLKNPSILYWAFF